MEGLELEMSPCITKILHTRESVAEEEDVEEEEGDLPWRFIGVGDDVDVSKVRNVSPCQEGGRIENQRMKCDNLIYF